MARIASRRYSRDLYIPWLQELVDHGDKVDVRGHTTYEILDCISIVEEPWHHCILIPSRRWNPWLALSEALWILAGRNDVAALKPYNSHIADYSDDGVTLYGAYGARIYHQIDDLVDRLRKDPSDRRAVLQIWDNNGPKANNLDKGWYTDLTANSKDPPCNNLVYFKLRDGKLNMTVINRSNDIHFGLFAVNLPTFGILQSYIAARLGVQMGTQTHLSNSLHVYTDDKRAVEITDRMLYTEENVPRYPAHEPVFKDLTWVSRHEEFATMCSDVIDGGVVYNPAYPDFLNFACNYLPIYKEHKEGFDTFYKWPNSSQYSWPDWRMAGQMFLGQAIH